MASVFDIVYLIEQQVRAPGAVAYLAPWNSPWAAEAWGAIGDAEVPVPDTSTLYFSDCGWVSAPTDSPAFAASGHSFSHGLLRLLCQCDILF